MGLARGVGFCSSLEILVIQGCSRPLSPFPELSSHRIYCKVMLRFQCYPGGSHSYPLLLSLMSPRKKLVLGGGKRFDVTGFGSSALGSVGWVSAVGKTRLQPLFLGAESATLGPPCPGHFSPSAARMRMGHMPCLNTGEQLQVFVSVRSETDRE